MSITVIRSIFCNGMLADGGCMRWFGQTPYTATELRREAAGRGWKRRRDGKDLCPDCAKEDGS